VVKQLVDHGGGGRYVAAEHPPPYRPNGLLDVTIHETCKGCTN